MAFNDNKVTTTQISTYGVVAAPDKLTGTAAENKAIFDRLIREIISESVNGLIEALQASTAASELGASVSSVTTKTVQAILSSFETAIANRYTKAETEALTGQETNSLVADVDVNLTTGVITVTKKDGTSETFDTAMEKVPARFEIVNSGGAVYLKITNVDGTSTQTDITSLMNVYTHANSDEISWAETGTGNVKTVSASIRANSIGLDKLSLSAISTLEGYVSSAADSATAAASSASSAQQSAASAQASKGEAATSEAGAIAAANDAQGSAEEAATAETNAKAAATTASTRAADSEAWAIGTRNGEVVGASDPAYQNNAKYYKERAAEIAGGDFIPATEKGADNGVATLNAYGQIPDNQIPLLTNYLLRSEKGSENGLATLDANRRLNEVHKPGYTASEVGAAAATHASQHASGGSDPITPADIGALPLSGGTITGGLTINPLCDNGYGNIRKNNSSTADYGTQLYDYDSDGDYVVLSVCANNDNDAYKLKFYIGATPYLLYGGHNQTTPVDSTPTVAKIRSSSLNSTETTPSLNGQIAWTYE